MELVAAFDHHPVAAVVEDVQLALAREGIHFYGEEPAAEPAPPVAIV